MFPSVYKREPRLGSFLCKRGNPARFVTDTLGSLPPAGTAPSFVPPQWMEHRQIIDRSGVPCVIEYLMNPGSQINTLLPPSLDPEMSVPDMCLLQQFLSDPHTQVKSLSL